eukprot:2845155-Amphidinium_carterae.2
MQGAQVWLLALTCKLSELMGRHTVCSMQAMRDLNEPPARTSPWPMQDTCLFPFLHAFCPRAGWCDQDAEGSATKLRQALEDGIHNGSATSVTFRRSTLGIWGIDSTERFGQMLGPSLGIWKTVEYAETLLRAREGLTTSQKAGSCHPSFAETVGRLCLIGIEISSPHKVGATCGMGISETPTLQTDFSTFMESDNDAS